MPLEEIWFQWTFTCTESVFMELPNIFRSLSGKQLLRSLILTRSVLNWNAFHRASEFLKWRVSYLSAKYLSIIGGEFKKKKLNNEIIAIRDGENLFSALQPVVSSSVEVTRRTAEVTSSALPAALVFNLFPLTTTNFWGLSELWVGNYFSRVFC